MDQSRDQNKTPETDSKEMQIYELSDKEFKVAVIKMLNELNEDTNRQLNEIRKTMHEQNENINEETETNSEADEYNN